MGIYSLQKLEYSKKKYLKDPTCEFFYYGVKILNDGKTKEIEIGATCITPISNPKIDDEKNVGHYGIGYRGNNGMLYEYGNKGTVFGPSFKTDDVIGFGANLITNDVFFTKNGKMIGFASENITNISRNGYEWFPAVSLHSKTAKVEINFGENPFIFNIREY